MLYLQHFIWPLCQTNEGDTTIKPILQVRGIDTEAPLSIFNTAPLHLATKRQQHWLGEGILKAETIKLLFHSFLSGFQDHLLPPGA